MRRLAKVAVLVAAVAVAAKALGQEGSYSAWTMLDCSDESPVGYFPSSAAACAVYGVMAYIDMNYLSECTPCDDDDYISPPPSRIAIRPPPTCPPGQHYAGGQCQDDHECGDDEIGGGSEECESCGEGEVPNADGSACAACEHGEASPGQCAADPCGIGELDAVAKAEESIPREGRERGRSYFCDNDEINKTAWSFSEEEERCLVTIKPKHGVSCWEDGPRPDACDLAAIHSHPYFTKADAGAICDDEIINEESAKFHNSNGMKFGPNDWSYSLVHWVDSYLVVPNRSCTKSNRFASRGGLATDVVVHGSCKEYEHIPWSTP